MICTYLHQPNGGGSGQRDEALQDYGVERLGQFADTRSRPIAFERRVIERRVAVAAPSLSARTSLNASDLLLVRIVVTPLEPG